MKQIEIVLVGESQVGKTSLVRQFVMGTFDSSELPTIGVDARRKTLDIPDNGASYRITLWDTSGMSRYKEMALHHIGSKLCVILVCSVTNAASFHALNDWKEKVLKLDSKARIAVIANQVDRKAARVVKHQELDEWCGRDIPLFECAATDNETVMNVITQIIETMLVRSVREETESSPASKGNKKPGSLNEPLIQDQMDRRHEDPDTCCCCNDRCSIL